MHRSNSEMNPPKRFRVLAITANEAVRSAVATSLAAQCEVYWAEHAAAAISELRELGDRIDALLIDIAHARPVDVAACQQVRALTPVPIIALVEPPYDPAALVDAFKLGVTQHLTLPLNTGELALVVEGVIARHQTQQMPALPPHLRFGDCVIDFQREQVHVGGQLARVAPTEWRFLIALARRNGGLVERRTLLREVWGEGYDDETRYLTTYANRLRQKLGSGIIVNERGGYRLVSDPVEATIPAQQASAEASTARRQRVVGNLPGQRAPFIGRTASIAQLSKLLAAANVRLVTLHGPPGMGKTSLTLAVGRVVAPHFPDGVWFVPLSTVTTGELLVATLAQQLRVPQGKEPLLTTLLQYLRDKRMLLVLDNLEQIADAAHPIAELLNGTQDLTILASSRVPLKVYGEWTYPVKALMLPPRSERNVQTLHGYEAMELFITRARAVRPDWSLTTANAQAVVEICRRVEGIPLAIELVVAQLRAYEPQELWRRSRFLLNTPPGPTDLPERQRTLRSAVYWSYRLLGCDEQALFQCCAVFADSMTATAVAAVVDAPIGLVTRQLDGLVNHSLLVSDERATGEQRYNMLEIMREFARERLERDGMKQNEAHRRHADYYMQLATAADSALDGPEQERWLQRLDSELPNFRAALVWLFAHDPRAGAELCACLARFWHRRGYFREGYGWLQGALGLDVVLEPQVKVDLLRGVGVLGRLLGQLDPAARALQEGLALAQAHNYERALPYLWSNWGMLLIEQGHYEEAHDALTTGVAVARAINEGIALSYLLNNLGVLELNRGNYEQARAWFDETLRVCEGHGDVYGVATALENLGMVARSLNQPDLAQELYQRSLISYEQLADNYSVAHVLTNQGVLALLHGHYADAATALRAALERYNDIGNQQGVIEALEALGGVFTYQGQPLVALELWACTAALRMQLDLAAPPGDQERYAAMRVDAERGCEAAEVVAAERRGRALTLDAAVGLALQKSE
jgi:predicted ATPase/DNA-binding response OmpR family regulator